MPSDESRHVVIVGGGFGGLAAARALGGSAVRVTVIDRRNFHLFQPLLYQVATGVLSSAEVAHPLRELMRKHRNVEVVLGEVMEVDVQGGAVLLLDEQRIPFDELILAPGSEQHWFGHASWSRLAPGPKTLEDAREIRARIVLAYEQAERETDPTLRAALLTFVVVGGGPTGVEMAGALAEIARHAMPGQFRHIPPPRARIILVQLEDRVLPTYHPDLSEQARRDLRRLRVEVWSETMVTEIHGSGVVVRRGDATEEIIAGTVLWAAGVRPSPLGAALAAAAGIPVERGGRVRVDEQLRIPGHPGIRVIGDLAHVDDGAGQPLPAVAPVATQQGRYVADRILEAARGTPSTDPFRYRDRGTMATIGRGVAVAEVAGRRFDGAVAWLLWLLVHLMYLVDFQSRAVVLVRWTWLFLTRRRPGLLLTEMRLPRWDRGASERRYGPAAMPDDTVPAEVEGARGRAVR